jgi:hypothetical protein
MIDTIQAAQNQGLELLYIAGSGIKCGSRPMPGQIEP